jgi:hypothetical protein
VSVHGFGVSMIIDLVNKGLAILTHEKVRADGKTIEVSKVLTTEAGRGALAAEGRQIPVDTIGLCWLRDSRR